MTPKQQLLQYLERMMLIHRALDKYYDNLVTDRSEYADDEITQQHTDDRLAELNQLVGYVMETTGMTTNDLMDLYGDEEDPEVTDARNNHGQ